MILEKYKYIAFDFDETLVDYYISQINAQEKAYNYFKVKYTEEMDKIYTKINKKYWSLLEEGKISFNDLRVNRFREFFSKINLDINPKDFSDKYLGYLSLEAYPLEGTIKTLEYFHGKLSIIIATNGFKDVQDSRIDISGIGKYIDGFVASEEAGKAKPDNVFFDFLFERFSISNRKDVLFVGDSLSSDMRGAYRYGIDSCFINRENKNIKAGEKIIVKDEEIRVNYVLNSVYELINI